MKTDIKSWLKEGKHLPVFMRDFHEQKRIFKWIGNKVESSKQAPESWTERMRLTMLPDWMSAHIYVLDYFLWFMAMHGWTLQRSRRPFAFRDWEADLREMEEQDAEAFRAYLEAERVKREAAS